MQQPFGRISMLRSNVVNEMKVIPLKDENKVCVILLKSLGEYFYSHGKKGAFPGMMAFMSRAGSNILNFFYRVLTHHLLHISHQCQRISRKIEQYESQDNLWGRYYYAELDDDIKRTQFFDRFMWLICNVNILMVCQDIQKVKILFQCMGHLLDFLNYLIWKCLEGK